jgi:hypothetical protein
LPPPSSPGDLPRPLARRLRELAASGEDPGASWRARVAWALSQVERAAVLVARDPALRRSALLPTTLTFLGAAAVAAVVAWRGAGEIFDVQGNFLRVAFASFVAISTMPTTLLWPMWKRLGIEARRALGATPGDEEHPGASYWRMVAHESVKAVRQAAVVGLGLAPVFVLVELLPGVGHRLTLALGATWAWYWVVLDCLEIPVELQPGRLGPGEPTWFERGLRELGARSRWLRFLGPTGRFVGWLSRPWRHQAEFTERQPWESTGFGAGAVVFLAIPVLGVFFRAVAITAATAMVVRQETTADRTADQGNRELARPADPV